MSNKKNSLDSSKSSSSSKILYTPYEKVLNILSDLKNYFSSKKEKISEKFIKKLIYIEKVITGHSLYEFEVKDKYKKDFVYQYNENVLKMKNEQNNQKSNIFKRSSAFYRQSTSLPALEDIIKKLNENNKSNNSPNKSIHTESSDSESDSNDVNKDDNNKNNNNNNNNKENAFDKEENNNNKNIKHNKNKSVDFNINKINNDILNNINNNNNNNIKNIKSINKNNNNNTNNINLNNKINLNINKSNNIKNNYNNNNNKNKNNNNNNINININITNNHNIKQITNKNNNNQLSLRSPNNRINLSPLKQRPFIKYKINNLEIDFEKILGKSLLKKIKQRNKSFKNLLHSNYNNFITNYAYKNQLLKRNNNNILDKKMYKTTLKTMNLNSNNNKIETVKKKKFYINSVNTSNLVQNSNYNIGNNINNNNINNNITLNYSINNSSPLRKLTKINFSKIYSNLKSHNFNILSILTKEFNIFELERIIGYYNVLPIIGKEILKHFGLINTEFINTKKLDNFLNTISTSYKKTTLYHNALHGSDVTQTICIFFLYSNIEKKINTNILDILSIVISALGHDLGHPGYNNLYLINSKNELAIRYNDISVLENFHSSFLWSILNNNETNIFDHLEKGDYSNLRKRMISLILATDMANHGKVVSKLKSMDLSKNENDLKFEERQNVLDFIIHSADLAHNVKLFKISLHWVSLLSEEFWRQGDEEKKNKLNVSFLCDRNDSNVPKSQVGFIKGFIIPSFEILVNIFPSLNFTIENAKNNVKEWEKLIEKGSTKGWENDEYNNNNNNK